MDIETCLTAIKVHVKRINRRLERTDDAYVDHLLCEVCNELGELTRKIASISEECDRANHADKIAARRERDQTRKPKFYRSVSPRLCGESE